MTEPSESLPPGAWPAATKLAARLVGPLERFLHIQTSSGILLLICAVIAMFWANADVGVSYEHVWETSVTFGFGQLQATTTLHFIINDILMVVFFFVVGLEIRREMHGGELSELRRAALPIGAALGGMLVPALCFMVLNRAPPERDGWGVPMATDIAFAVGVLALLGNRVPSALRVLLLALAIIDDIGAIVVIAVFYSSGVSLTGLGIAALAVAVVFTLQRLGVRRPLLYIPAGALLWAGLLKGGIHPTIAGVILGLLTPARAWYGEQGFVSAASAAVSRVRTQVEGGQGGRKLMPALADISRAGREALAPAVRLEATLHPWVAFGIMPLFALANAGVPLTGLDVSRQSTVRLAIGIAVGLCVGKPAGILLGAWCVERLGITRLPARVTWPGVAVVGMVAGIGFTMAVFIAGLAFPPGPELAVAKVAVLVASFIAGASGLLLGFVALRRPEREARDISVDEAERSTLA